MKGAITVGCDIHGPYIEQVDWYRKPAGGMALPTDPGAKPGWWGCIAELDWGRDYELFALLADVRCEDNGFSNWCGNLDHKAAKGFPWVGFPSEGDKPPSDIYGQMSINVGDHVYPYSDIDDDGSGGRVHGGDCHSQTWLTLPEITEVQLNHVKYHGKPNNDVAMALVIMTTAAIQYPNHEVRLITCFDN